MTIFTDRLVLKLNHSLPLIEDPIDVVRKIYWFEDGKWAPQGFTDHGISYLTLTNSDNDDDPLLSPLNLFAYTTMPGFEGEPILAADRGLTVQKDITAGGFVGSNQGELWLGSGRANQLSVPKIMLQNSGVSILNGGGYLDIPPVPAGHAGSGSFPIGQPSGTFFLRIDESGPYKNRVYKYDGSNWNDTTPTNTAASQLFRSTDAIFGQVADTIFKSAYNSGTGTWNWTAVGPASNYSGKYFDTLYLTKLDGSAAHFDLGNLTAHGSLIVETQLKVKSTHNMFAVTAGDDGANQDTYLIPQNPSNGMLGLGTVAYPFKWVKAKDIVTDTIHSLTSNVVEIPQKIDCTGGIDSLGNVTTLEGGGFIAKPSSGTTNWAFQGWISGEANPLFYIQNNGTIKWGPGGSNEVDTDLYRSDTDLLKTDNNFEVAKQLKLYSDMGNAPHIDIHNFGGTKAGVGFTTASGWSVRLGTEQNTWWLALYNYGYDVKHGWTDTDYCLKGDGSAIKFGSSGDVNLYRSNGNLKTDNNVEIAQQLRLYTGTVADAQLDIYNTNNTTGTKAGIRLRTASQWIVRLITEQDNWWLALYSNSYILQHGWKATDYYLRGDTSHIFFGLNGDVNLYRSSNKLRTDNAFQAANYYSADGTAGYTGTLGGITFKNGLAVG